ncbi:cytochrome c peroxidase [Methylibium sp.]|uniref:cytochrome-c peroxidase n=1 Tax=Methylibium sp. TaxID=2067992 RepID=UPI0025E004C5|nr:cytochrome c peroxidase [Methylibium sp.]
MFSKPYLFRRSKTIAFGLFGVAVAGALSSGTVWTQDQVDVQSLASLKTVRVPGPPDAVLNEYVRDKRAAIQLGKALFWDIQVGSDRKQACASCHFHAGADNRIKNQLSPGLLAGDKTFQVGGPNHELSEEDFPFTKHLNPDRADSRRSDKNDVASSQGVFRADFISAGGKDPDTCLNLSERVDEGGNGFHVGGVNVRQVEPRNTPTTINAVFNFRNFWDGRAVNDFNGGDPFGLRNPNAFVFKAVNGQLQQIAVAIPFSSLASQASGPPLSAFEMSCNGRSFVELGRTLLEVKPLGKQKVHQADSVLGPLADPRGNGLKVSYGDLIRKAFQPAYWKNGPAKMTPQERSMDLIRRASRVGDPGGANGGNGGRGAGGAGGPRGQQSVEHIEANFALFFGLSLQLYQASLVSDDTPFDRFLEGKRTALDPQQSRGLKVFTGQGKCINCHGGAELTNASVRNVLNERLERMVMGNGGEAVYDNGFYNIGVRPTAEDLGVGGKDPFGNPLSETRIAQLGKTRLLGNQFDPDKEPSVQAGDRVAVDGAFKTPGLRNVELTGPYFHNGGNSTLKQVVEFYNRGGDFAKENQADLDPDIQPLGLSEAQQDDLVAFLLSLTDDRVRFQRAPFDHPSLCVPNGHPGDEVTVPSVPSEGGDVKIAEDLLRCIAPVGKRGSPTALKPFLDGQTTPQTGQWDR